MPHHLEACSPILIFETIGSLFSLYLFLNLKCDWHLINDRKNDVTYLATCIKKSKLSGWDYLVEDFDSQLQILFQIEASYVTPHRVTLIRWSSMSSHNSFVSLRIIKQVLPSCISCQSWKELLSHIAGTLIPEYSTSTTPLTKTYWYLRRGLWDADILQNERKKSCY